ncbi:hypothetical protein NGRA_1730 [Nosema granulosis]|uniref:Uncharacterized protein n=1 Tax=Nosema granulosis TaxID=83296 RepID=A0A9P6GZH6_9MICR|nr:hypothetical protein NGRA_1730 [Nosema granulosis]
MKYLFIILTAFCAQKQVDEFKTLIRNFRRFENNNRSIDLVFGKIKEIISSKSPDYIMKEETDFENREFISISFLNDRFIFLFVSKDHKSISKKEIFYKKDLVFDIFSKNLKENIKATVLQSYEFLKKKDMFQKRIIFDLSCFEKKPNTMIEKVFCGRPEYEMFFEEKIIEFFSECTFEIYTKKIRDNLKEEATLDLKTNMVNYDGFCFRIKDLKSCYTFHYNIPLNSLNINNLIFNNEETNTLEQHLINYLQKVNILSLTSKKDKIQILNDMILTKVCCYALDSYDIHVEIIRMLYNDLELMNLLNHKMEKANKRTINKIQTIYYFMDQLRKGQQLTSPTIVYLIKFLMKNFRSLVLKIIFEKNNTEINKYHKKYVYNIIGILKYKLIIICKVFQCFLRRNLEKQQQYDEMIKICYEANIDETQFIRSSIFFLDSLVLKQPDQKTPAFYLNELEIINREASKLRQ